MLHGVVVCEIKYLRRGAFLLLLIASAFAFHTHHGFRAYSQGSPFTNTCLRDLYSSEMPMSNSAMIRAGFDRNTILSVGAIIAMGSLPTVSTAAVESQDLGEKPILTRADVGFIDLNETEPAITDVCWMDIKIGDADPQRIEISLYGGVVPKTVANFKALCKGDAGYGYKGSDIFRVISTFSVQGGNIGQPQDAAQSQFGKYGKAADGNPFPAENFRILHSYKGSGIVSMMKDIMNKGMQDSRFFITTSPNAGWADDKYVAFGRVTKGMDLIEAMQIVQVKAPTNYPLTRIEIVDAGCY